MLRYALRSLLGRKVRLLMSTLAVVLGVAFVTGTLVFSATLDRSFSTLFDATVGDVVVEPVAGGSPRRPEAAVPQSLVEDLADLPGAARADGRIRVIGVYVVGTDGKPVGGFGPPALAGTTGDAPAANGTTGLVLVAGREPRGLGEIVVDDVTAARAGYEIGDQVPLVSAFDDATLTATMVGLYGFPGGGSMNGASFVGVEPAVAQRFFLDGADAWTTAWVTAAPGTSQAELAAQVAAVLPGGLRAVTGDEAAADAASTLLRAVSFLTTFLLVFAGIALVVGAFLIVNTFSILVAQRSRELALLRALGASRRQVTGSVLVEAGVMGLVGGTVGLGLGLLTAVALQALFAALGLDLSGQALVVTWTTPAAAYAVAVLVTMTAALLPALRTTRIPPVAALRDDVALPEGSLRRRGVLGVVGVAAGAVLITLGLRPDLPGHWWWLALGVLAVLLGTTAAAPLLARPVLRALGLAYERALGTVGRLAALNTLRQPRRTAGTASALMIGLTVASTLAIVGASAKASVDATIAETFPGDHLVSSAFGAPFSTSLADRVAGVDGVGEVVRERLDRITWAPGSASTEEGTAEGEDLPVAATDADDADVLRLTVLDGAVDLAPGLAVVQQALADERGIAAGDTLDVVTPEGPATWRVSAVVEDNPMIFADVLVGTGTYDAAGLLQQDWLLVVLVADGADPTAVGAALSEELADQPTVTVADQRAFAAAQREPIDRIVLIVYALLALALLIAVLGIVNTLALSVVERTREIGMLRAVGLSRAGLRRMVTLESVAIAVLGALLGLVLGTVFGVVLMRALREEGLEVVAVPVGQLLAFLVAAVVVGVLAAVLPARRAARQDVLTALASE
ncbi:ABC transporter permease [Nocardioides bruguierae]|uniref:ABC transporter permease n=1 Tax=Nocardioides bruguierae TaxID=2945102 RepID=UPI0020205010|nr:FtsX family ABC transporter permease [Nocardioides bruguierae]MCL8024158.1 FtsX-like permease family protein [Nocardioides bruguierae]